MPLSNKKIEIYLAQANLAITNALASPEIMECLAVCLYDEQRLRQGLVLYDEAYRRYQGYQRAYGDSYIMAEQVKQARGKAREKLSYYRNLARLALKEQRDVLAVLGMNARPKRSLGGWLEDARLFYNNAMDRPEIREALAGLGVTEEKLRQARALADELEKVSAAHEAAKGEALTATKDRDAAFKAFKNWMKDFRKICRIALSASPQRLEKLDMTVKG
jgi:hypothetical protein